MRLWDARTCKMSDVPAERSADARYEALAHRRRRCCLEALRNHSSPVPERRLASELAPTAGEDDAEARSAARERVFAELVHRHLPKLEASALVDWDRDAGTVTLAGDLPFADSRFSKLLDLDGDHWDAVLSVLSSKRRRVAIRVFEETGSPLSGAELARRVAAREASAAPSAVPDEAVRSVRTSLHHVHLPKLERIDAVRREDDAIAYDGHPGFDAGLLRAENDDGQPSVTGDRGRAD